MIILIPFQNETIFTAKRQKFGIILLWILAVVISSITYIYYIISTSESIISSIRNYLNTRRNTLASIPPNQMNWERNSGETLSEDILLVFRAFMAESDYLMILVTPSLYNK